MNAIAPNTKPFLLASLAPKGRPHMSQSQTSTPIYTLHRFALHGVHIK
jgi:hypothetical protein